jgi:MarR family
MQAARSARETVNPWGRLRSCLDLITRHGPLSPSAPARRAGLHPATMTGILDRLERGGWVIEGIGGETGCGSTNACSAVASLKGLADGRRQAHRC